MLKQQEQVINLTDSIFENNKRQFPTSYLSSNFEGYSMLVPNYEKKILLIRSFIFFTDTKYGTDYFYNFKQNSSLLEINYPLLDSIYYRKNKTTFHSFQKEGDTLLLVTKNKINPKRHTVPITIISQKDDYTN